MIAKIIIREFMIVAIDTSGKVSVLLALILGLVDWLGALNVNGFLTAILSILGIIYIVVKIYLGYLDFRIKNLDVQIKKKELEEPDV